MRFARSFVVLVLLLAVSACSLPVSHGSDDYYELASALTKLSRAVETSVRYDPLPPNASAAQVLDLATAHDPGLRAPFAAYHMELVVADKHAVLLVCDAGKRRGLLEDAGCTAKLDRHIWQEADGNCLATLDVGRACASPATSSSAASPER